VQVYYAVCRRGQTLEWVFFKANDGFSSSPCQEGLLQSSGIIKQKRHFPIGTKASMSEDGLPASSQQRVLVTGGTTRHAQIPSSSSSSSNSTDLSLLCLRYEKFTLGAGWVASYCIKELLDRGFWVRATVRNLKSKKHYEFLYEVSPGCDEASNRLEIVEADLRNADSWDAACAGCSAVLHVAGVVELTPKHAKKDLIEPALKGIENVFGAAHRSRTVKRIVLTSSIAAVSEDFADWKKHTYTAEDFNHRSTIRHNPYFYSKLLEENAAREFVKTHEGMSLTVICPNSIVGPSLNSSPGLATGQAIVNPLLGKVPVRFPMSVGWIDVRDLAKIHVEAMLAPEAAGQRYIASRQFEPMDHLLDLLVAEMQERRSKLPKRRVSGSLILALVHLTQPVGNYRALKWTVNKMPKLENSNVQRDLKVEYRPIEETVHDTCFWVKEKKLLEHHRKHKEHSSNNSAALSTVNS